VKKTYTFKIAPDYTTASYDHGGTSPTVTMDEWFGRSLEEFAAGMKGRGYTYRTETYTLDSGRKIEEHIWERDY
jgi:hypothetical protein